MTVDAQNQTSILAVVLEYGATTLRFCDANEDTDIGVGIHTADPLLRFVAPERTGLLEEDDGELFMSSEWGFVDECTVGRAFAPIKATVVEYVFDAQDTSHFDAQTIYHFAGAVLSGEINPDDEAGTVKFVLLNAKHRTDKPLDNLALEKCRNDFGSGKVCQFNLLDARENATMTALDRTSATIVGMTTQPPGWWKDGYVQFDGTLVKIRSWDGANGFVLQQLPPVTWVDLIQAGNLAVVIAPGCDRSAGDCARYEQIDVFRGIGIDIPDHHPMFEKPRFVS